MENTSRVFFTDDRAQWFLAEGANWTGPWSASQIQGLIAEGKASLAHYLWKKGMPGWKRVCEIKAFDGLSPAAPTKGTQAEVARAIQPTVKVASPRPKPPVPTPPLTDAWYIYFQNAEHGPFESREVVRLVIAGKITPSTFLWAEGMAQWEPLEKISAFSQIKPTARKTALPMGSKPSEKRAHPRRPLVAELRLTNGSQLFTGMCRDISIGGMQVLTNELPGTEGTHLQLNITLGGSAGGPKSFVARGTIVRILEDGRGFSFRFNDLPAATLQMIQTYIAKG